MQKRRKKRFHLFDKALNASSRLLETERERLASCLLCLVICMKCENLFILFYVFLLSSTLFPKCYALLCPGILYTTCFSIVPYLLGCVRFSFYYFFSSSSSYSSMSPSPLLPYATATDSSLFSFVFLSHRLRTLFFLFFFACHSFNLFFSLRLNYTCLCGTIWSFCSRLVCSIQIITEEEEK